MCSTYLKDYGVVEQLKYITASERMDGICPAASDRTPGGDNGVGAGLSGDGIVCGRVPTLALVRVAYRRYISVYEHVRDIHGNIHMLELNRELKRVRSQRSHFDGADLRGLHSNDICGLAHRRTRVDLLHRTLTTVETPSWAGLGPRLPATTLRLACRPR